MVPGRFDGQRRLLRTGLRKAAGRYPQERVVPGWLSRERQLLRPLKSTGVAGEPSRVHRSFARLRIASGMHRQ
jgi:hypothetical protein